ncbi:WXG100 family type VII secretion target [Amycolatopsis azurea]|uniref:Rhs protein n=1 Tax=Amycolatopsis azurea DSM 43854 TaxID=1238180 RepID=M2PQW5_9PSEU|nr:PPE domain-containing protein [Amycolatopsis azurea]EMD26928.1 rhs protein [Amycolatopsis azurea DSM 43854]OOC06905.1 rhs protein [Amycolatopsis azurea DSM 43854]
MSEDLIAKKEEKSEPFKGGGILDSGSSVVGDIFKATKGEDLDAFAVAMDGVSFGLDVLSMVLNPLGELVKAGVGWLMENLDFIREPLEILTGDPELVQQAAQTWNNIAAELEAVAGDYEGSLSTTSGWDGDAAIAYRRVALQYTQSLRDVAAEAKDSAQWITTGGMVVATARALIFDIIAGFISDVITRALLALASSWFTLGGSVAAFTASIFADAVKVMAKIQKKLGKLLGAIQRFVKRFEGSSERAREATRALGRKSSELGREANKAIKASDKTLDGLKGDNLKYLRSAKDRLENTTAGKIAENTGLKVAKEAGKAAAADYNQYDGGSPERGQVVPPKTGRISGSLDDDD